MTAYQTLLEWQQGVATRAQLTSAGVTRRQLDRLLLERGLTRVGRALYRDGPPPSRGPHLLSGGRCDLGFVAEVRQALLAAGPGARAAGRTAAVLWRFDLIVEPVAVQLHVPHGRRPGPGARQSRRPSSALVVPVAGRAPLPVTSAVDTVLDCALELPLVEAVVVADSALRAGACTLGQLRRSAEARRGDVGSGRLRRVLRWCDPRSESVLESALRVVLCEAGLEPSAVQHQLGPHRLDLAWPEQRLAAEADGRRWHDPEDRRDADRRRDNDAVRRGWRVLRFTWREVVHDPAAVVSTVREALAAPA